MENWRMHPVYVDYEVSDLGRVRRRTAKGGTRIGRLKTPSLNSTGYLTVNLGRKVLKVHALVLECFVCPRPDKHDACHNDGTRTNNVLSNLRWATRKENMQDAVLHGTAQINADRLRAYWAKQENRDAQSERTSRFCQDNPGKHTENAVLRTAGQARPEVREKMRAAKLGKKQSPESIEKRAVALRKPRREGTGQRISEAKRAAFARRRLAAAQESA